MSYMGNERHLEKGEPEPSPPGKDVLRVYGMKFCPFVHRLKLVLAAKGIEHETVNVNLKYKPDWLWSKNPRGVVPIIEKNGDILYESDITSEYIDDAYKGKMRVTEVDPMLRAKGKMVISNLTFGSLLRARLAKTKGDKAEAAKKIVYGLKTLENFFYTTGNSFISGSSPGMNDFMLWPILERLSLYHMDEIDQFKCMREYFGRMGDIEAVKLCRHPADLHRQWIEKYMRGEVEYDIGTVLPSKL